LFRFKKKHPVFILGVSNSECSTCCYSEPLLQEIAQEFDAGNFLHKGKKIPVVRVDIATDGIIFEREGVLFE
jgi:hypothetical protein